MSVTAYVVGSAVEYGALLVVLLGKDENQEQGCDYNSLHDLIYL